MSSLREAFLKPIERPSESISVPELGVNVTVQGMTARERSEYDAQFRLPSGKPNKKKQLQGRQLLLIACCVDENGEHLFTASDADQLGNLPASVVEPLVDAALRVSGMTAADVEDTAKNSDETDDGS